MDLRPTQTTGGSRRVTIDIVDLEGTLAVGKSTMLRTIAEHPEKLVHLLKLNGADVPETKVGYYTRCCVVEEPLEAWTAVGVQAENLLASAYRGDRGGTFACQLNVVSTRLAAIATAIERVVTEAAAEESGCDAVRILVVTERSTFADRHVFAAAAHENELMSDAEWHIYQQCYDEAHAAWRATIAALCLRSGYGSAYVQCIATVVLVLNADIAHKRIKERGRHYERQLTRQDIAAIADRTQCVFVRSRTKYGITHRRVVRVNALTLHEVLVGRAKSSVLMQTTLQPVVPACTVY